MLNNLAISYYSSSEETRSAVSCVSPSSPLIVVAGVMTEGACSELYRGFGFVATVTVFLMDVYVRLFWMHKTSICRAGIIYRDPHICIPSAVFVIMIMVFRYIIVRISIAYLE